MDVAMNAQGIAVEEQLGERTISRLHGIWSIGSFTGAAITSFLLSRHVPAQAIVLELLRVRDPAGVGCNAGLSSRAPKRVCTSSPMRCGRMAGCCFWGWWPSSPWSAKARSPTGAGLYLRVVRGAGLGVSGYGYAVFAALMVTGRLAGDSVVARVG